MAKITAITKNNDPIFSDISAWHSQNMHSTKIDFNDPKPYEIYAQGKWCGVFQCTGDGAQKFFIKNPPKSITEIAANTSIYRPGPLAAKVDALWKEHETVPYDWGHPLINDVLKETRGLLVFQESVMQIANKVAGYPLAETDEIRRLIMKRSLATGAAQKKKLEELEVGFIAGCVKNGVPKDIAEKAYNTVCAMSGYGFNKSHAVAYAIDSFWCAWLLTYFEPEWIMSYIEAMINSPEKKIKAISEIKRLGYTIAPIDINLSSKDWSVIPGKKIVPSLLSCKGIGDAAVDEVLQKRPYKSIEDLLWNEDGTWKHSKFNKRALEALIKIGAFESLDCVGDDKLFNSYHHMHEVIINNIDAIKKTNKKDPHQGRKAFYEIARSVGRLPEWSRRERVEFQVEVYGNLDVTTLVDPAILNRLVEKEVKSIDIWDEKDIYWFCIQTCTPKKTKNNKNYLDIEVVGLVGKTFRAKVWNWDGKTAIEPYTVMIAEINKNEFGFSASFGKMKELK
jgi:DNA polymerase III alpha subunit